MALYMMEAIADFSRQNQRTSVNLVRVVVFQGTMVAPYLEEMQKAGKPGSSFLGVVTAPFRFIGNKIRDLWRPDHVHSGGGGAAVDEEAPFRTNNRPVVIPKAAASLDLIILGLDQKSIDEVSVNGGNTEK